MLDIAVTSTRLGGFQLLLPGKHFKIMNQVSHESSMSDPRTVAERLEDYHKDHEKFLLTFQADFITATYPTIQENVDAKEKESLKKHLWKFANLAFKCSYQHKLLTDK